MLSVIDVGCATHGDEDSVHALIERFHPDTLFGFDPFPGLDEGVEYIGQTLVERRRVAAWTEEGTVFIRIQGNCTGIVGDTPRPYEQPVEVPCIDLVAFLERLVGRVILKLDAEGSEYPLLSAIHEQGADKQLELVLVEWHDGVYAHGLYQGRRPQLRCPIEEWPRPQRDTPAGPTSRVLRSFA